MKSGWEVDNWKDAWRVVVGSDHEDADDVQKNVAYILSGYQGERGAVLEIGAGYGRLIRAMRKRFPIAIGVDSSQAMVEFSTSYLYPDDPGDMGSGTVVKGDGSLLPVISDFFHFVYSYIAFQHMHTLDIVRSNIQETFRVLKSGGVCRIQTVKGKSNFYEGEGCLHKSHLFENENDFAQLFLDAGFSHVDVMVGLSHPEHIWVTARKS